MRVPVVVAGIGAALAVLGCEAELATFDVVASELTGGQRPDECLDLAGVERDEVTAETSDPPASVTVPVRGRPNAVNVRDCLEDVYELVELVEP